MTEQTVKDPRTREAQRLEAVKRMLAAQGAIANQVGATPAATVPNAPAGVAVEASSNTDPEPKTPPAEQPAQAPKGAGEEGESKFKQRVDQLTHKLKLAEERAAKADKMESEIAKLRSELSQAKREKLPDELAAEAAKIKGFSEWPDERKQAYVASLAAERVVAEAPSDLPDDVQQILEHHKMQKRFGGNLTFEQVEALTEVARGAPGLSDRQLMLLAKDSYPDLYGATERSGGLPPSHVVQSPTSTSAPAAGSTERDERGRFAAAMANARTRKEKRLLALEETKRRLGLHRRP